MEQPTVAMELGERIDVAEILSLKHALEILPINTPSQVLNAEKVTHMDSASCQLLYAYSQYLFVFNSALIVATPSDKFIFHY
jgi:anti-anti-sigma regulatory factor